jgi:elongation of very long chain fatty acids protein 6
MKVRIPRLVSMIITFLQLSQMIIGCWINLQAWQYKKNGEICQVTDENLKVSLMMYGTYFLLFAHFFLGSYIFKTKQGNKQHEHEKVENLKKMN